jgi:hypothetical protein
VVAYVKEDAEKALADAQDLLDEARDVALAHSAVYQQSLRNYHSRRVRGGSFESGNLVLRLKQTSMSKLEPPWEGPYLVHEVIPGGAYRLRNPKTGVDIENPWNAQQLRRFYPQKQHTSSPSYLYVIKRRQQTTLNHCAFGTKQ